MTVTAAAVATGPVSGCSLNPAASLGSMLTARLAHGPRALDFWSCYVLAPLVGAVAAFCLFYVARQRYEYAPAWRAPGGREEAKRELARLQTEGQAFAGSSAR